MSDAVVDQVVAEFQRRSELGIKKYGTTLAENEAHLIERVQHLKEELMDATLYCQWILNRIAQLQDDGK